MPRKNVPHRVDEIADSIMKSMKDNKSKLSEKRKYDIAYGTAWKQYYKENPDAKKERKKKSSNILGDLKIAQELDDCGFFFIADSLD
jgi:hypothetical protein